MKNITRRQFGKMTFGALTGVTIAAEAKLGAKKAASSVFGGLQIGVMTYSFRDRPLDKALENIVGIGIDSAELYSGHLDPLKARDDEIKAWRKRFAEAGVKIGSFYVEMEGNPSDQEIDRCFEGARLIGTNTLSASLAKDLVARVDKACRKFKMKLGLHNHWFNPPDPRQFQDPQDFLDALNHSSEWMSITLDVGHFHAAGHDPVKFIEAHHGRIVSLHLKDRGDDPQHTDHPYGEGSTPLIPVVKTLQKLRFKRAANIEWEVENADPYKGVADGLAYFKKALT